jgi:putative transposase
MSIICPAARAPGRWEVAKKAESVKAGAGAKKKGQRTFCWPQGRREGIIVTMPRHPRASQAGYCYHVLNRGNGRRTLFQKEGDFAAVVMLLGQAGERTPVRLLAYCLMRNHFHLAHWPRADGDLSAYMGWLLTAHVRRYHQHYHGSGPIYQGPFRSFPIQEDDHLLTVLRYIERNPVRAGLVASAQAWPWSSAAPRQGGQPTLEAGPVPRPARWLDYVNGPQTEAEVEALRKCIRRRRPFGEASWMDKTARVLGLEASLRPRGRPRKPADGQASLFGSVNDLE